MGQVAYRANLSSASYPMTISDGGRTVIIPGPDNNYDRRVDPTGQQLDAGIPQALYLENVMPTSNGYQSVGYWAPSVAMTIPSAGAFIAQLVEVRATVYSVGPSIYTYSIANIPIYVWSDGNFTAGPGGINTVTFAGTPITGSLTGVYSTAVINGICYLYFSSFGVKELYEVTANVGGNLTLTNVTASVTPASFFSTDSIISICSTNNYLVCHNNTTVYWSSTTTPTDFVSSLVSGAGQINPNSSDDGMVYVKETLNGFYCYAANNIIYSQYTGNARYPFKFTPVTNSTGLFSGKRWEFYGQVDTGGHYVIEKNKNIKFMQQNEISPIAPDLSDFLSKNPVQELFNSGSNTFTAQNVETGVPSIYVHMNRYILVSVNGTNLGGFSTEKYSYVVIFDTHLRRYGKLKLDHSFMFSFWTPNEIIGFVNKQNNTIRYLNFDIFGSQSAPFLGLIPTPSEGVIVLGKFQYARSRFIKLEDIEIESPQNTAIVLSPNFSCALLPSLDGRNFDTAVPLASYYISGGVAKFPCHQTAQNISILLKGAFNVNTAQLKFTPAGDR